MMYTLLFFLILGCVQQLNSREIGRVKRQYPKIPCSEGNKCNLPPDSNTPVITDDGRCECKFNNQQCTPEKTCLDPDYRAVLYRRNPESDYDYCTCVLATGKEKSKKDCKLKRALGAYLVKNLNGKDLEECEDEEDGEEEFSSKIVPDGAKPRRNEPQSPCKIRKFFTAYQVVNLNGKDMADCEEDKKEDDVVSVNENQQSAREGRIEAINRRVSCFTRKLFGSYRASHLDEKDDPCKEEDDNDDDDDDLV